ncbi:hypothetical protein CYMTET_17769 [Cymbomonas tetramitiformis]|uniref:Uncharacterized protein n=1 Tax=Cymbomonas tetramitiformis TaxID=36881 RepID=A0AAE0G9F8_9CHLO|nr:hypothetical protein CYMTET_17769 [Cymbomonas tetramitiformis]
MMAPAAAARKVEESKLVATGDIHSHELVIFGVEVHGGLGPAEMRFLKKIQQRRFTWRRYTEEDVAEEEEVNEEGADEEEEVGGLSALPWAWEDAFDETDYATQAGRAGQEGEMQGFGRAQHGQSRHLLVGQARQRGGHNGSWKVWKLCSKIRRIFGWRKFREWISRKRPGVQKGPNQAASSHLVP